MPIHDWSRVSAGTFHDFHHAWTAEIRKALNTGLLPPNYNAQLEGHNGEPPAGEAGAAATAVITTAPRVRFVVRTEMDEYVLKRRTLVIRHNSDDRIVALIEILSPGNKSSRHALRSFVTKATEALYLGYHLLLVDLHAPGPRDPQGIHGAVWAEVSDEPYIAPPDKPLTLAAYSAGQIKTAYIEPVAVGDALPDMPLFLEPEAYVSVPLEATYQAAWRGVPQRWRRVLEAP